MANSKQFTLKNKSVTYTRAFIELYNQRNCGQVFEIYGIIEFKKIRTLTIENLYNLDAY